MKLVQIEWMVLTLAQGMWYFSPMASAAFALLVSSYLIASVHLELPPPGLLHSKDNSHHKKRIGIIIIPARAAATTAAARPGSGPAARISGDSRLFPGLTGTLPLSLWSSAPGSAAEP